MFNNILFFLGIVRIKIADCNIPLTVIFNVTNRCNNSCKHCYAAYPNRDNSFEMNTDQAKRLIKDLKDNGCLRVSFSGGEPLLREDIIELIDCAKKNGMAVTLNSNGILVSKYLNELKKLDALAISLDGHPEHHNILRGKNSGEKAIEGIRQAVQFGIKV